MAYSVQIYDHSNAAPAIRIITEIHPSVGTSLTVEAAGRLFSPR
jgi:hypothetical protein